VTAWINTAHVKTGSHPSHLVHNMLSNKDDLTNARYKSYCSTCQNLLKTSPKWGLKLCNCRAFGPLKCQCPNSQCCFCIDSLNPGKPLKEMKGINENGADSDHWIAKCKKRLPSNVISGAEKALVKDGKLPVPTNPSVPLRTNDSGKSCICMFLLGKI
jgi:hypothetical protein